jgi:hypothetical protein
MPAKGLADIKREFAGETERLLGCFKALTAGGHERLGNLLQYLRRGERYR